MTAPDPLFELGRRTLHTLRHDLAHYQIDVAPSLELRRGTSALSYYNLQDGQIYLSTPNPQASRGKFQILLFRSVVQLDSDTDVYRLLELLIPWLIAHEIGHHLRHRAGRLGQDIWQEERIANLVAGTLIKPKLSASERAELLALLSQAIGNIDAELKRHHPTSTLPQEPVERKRAEQPPQRDPLGYIYRHMRWLYEDLMTQETPQLERLAQLYLCPQPAQATRSEGGEAKPS